MTHIEELHYLFKQDTGHDYWFAEETYREWLEARLERQTEIN